MPSGGGACGSCEFYDSCRGGCMAAKFFTGLPLDSPDPECVRGFGADALLARGDVAPPRPSLDHSHTTAPRGRRSRPVPVSIGRRAPAGRPVSACEESPLAGFVP